MVAKLKTHELDAALARVAHAADLASERRLKLALQLSRAKVRQLEREGARLAGVSSTITHEKDELDARLVEEREVAKAIEADIGLTSDARNPLTLDLDAIAADAKTRLVRTRGLATAPTPAKPMRRRTTAKKPRAHTRSRRKATERAATSSGKRGAVRSKAVRKTRPRKVLPRRTIRKTSAGHRKGRGKRLGRGRRR